MRQSRQNDVAWEHFFQHSFASFYFFIILSAFNKSLTILFNHVSWWIVNEMSRQKMSKFSDSQRNLSLRDQTKQFTACWHCIQFLLMFPSLKPQTLIVFRCILNNFFLFATVVKTSLLNCIIFYHEKQTKLYQTNNSIFYRFAKIKN